MIPLTHKVFKSYLNQRNYDICKENFCKEHSICNLKYNGPKKIPMVFHNGSNYDYNFILRELAKEFEEKFICLGESTKKYKALSVPIKKNLNKLVKMRKKLKTVSYFYNF